MVLGQIMARWTQNSLVSTVRQPGMRSDKGRLSCPPRIATFQMICTHPTLEIPPQDFAGHDLQVKLKPVVTRAPSNHMNSWTQELFKLMIWTHCQNRHPDHIEGFRLVCIDQSSSPPGTGPLFTPGVPSECALHPIDHLSGVPLHWGWGRGWAWDCSRFPADYLLSSCGLYEKESFLITPGSQCKSIQESHKNCLFFFHFSKDCWVQDSGNWLLAGDMNTLQSIYELGLLEIHLRSSTA